MVTPASDIIRLATRGDDAGSARSANRAIREAAEHGILRNVSLMACTPHIAHARDLLADLPGVAFGCHATINAEWDFPRWGPVLPASQVPTLVGPDGLFLHTPVQTHDRGVAVAETMAEIAAQVARLRMLGFRLAYLDFHMGFQWFPGLQTEITAFCRREGLIDLDALKLPRPGAGIPDLPADPVQRMLIAIDRLAPGDHLLVTHPCCDDDEMAAYRGARVGLAPGQLGKQRDRDRALLTDAAVAAKLRDRGVRLVTFPELVAK